MSEKLEAFCSHRRQWLAFMWHWCSCHKWGEDEDKCGYVEMRKPTKYFKRKARILQSYSEPQSDE